MTCERRSSVFLAIPVVVGIVIEDQIHHGQPGQRRRPQVRKVRNPVHLDFDGDGDLLLDFFRSSSQAIA